MSNTGPIPAGTDRRARWMLHVPSRVLRGLIRTHVPGERQKLWLERESIRYRDPGAVLNRLTVEQLIRLINAHSEHLPDSLIEGEFREYWHGRSPTLHLYDLPSAGLSGFELSRANECVPLPVERANRALRQETGPEGTSPRLQELVLEPFHQVAEWPHGLHAGYHIQSRLDYIAVDGMAASTYELLYGHVWVDLGRAFLALHIRPARLEPTLVWLVSQVLRVPLCLIRVDKQLKAELRFLQRASCRRARLVDPSPDRQRFRSITLGDDQDLAHRRYLGWTYQQWEDDFPEMASARYYADFLASRDAGKARMGRKTSLSIGVRRGSLTLSGAVAASELCAWARDTGSQIVGVWRLREQRYLGTPAAVLDHDRLRQHSLLACFPEELGRDVLMLIDALATIKERQDPQLRSWSLERGAAALALEAAGARAQEVLGWASRAGGPAPWFNLMVRVDCPVEGCPSMREHLVCPSCGRALFTLSLSDQAEKVLMCANARCRDRWAGAFPLQTQCESEHPIELGWDERMDERLELFVGWELAFLMQELLQNEAAAYHFNARRESLWVRGNMFVHQPTRPDYAIRKALKISIHSGGGAVIMGSLEVHGDFQGRDKIVYGDEVRGDKVGGDEVQVGDIMDRQALS